MAFTIFYKIPFKSLRTGTVYTVNIYKDATLPTGYPLTLKGGAEPFTTDEDSSEDMFTPIRTQTGYIRIEDDGYAINTSNQSVAFDWHDIAAKTATDRPVTLTYEVSNVTYVAWQGFIQAQNFGSELNNPFNEIEFPVQCPIGAIATYDPSTTTIELKNFAYLLDSALSKLPSPIAYDEIMIQGGVNAQQWLIKKYDWQNFLDDGTNEEDELVAGYNYQEMLEDMCKYWGWTLRTKGTTLYLVCADIATAEQNFLKLTRAQLTDLGTYISGTIPGDPTNPFIPTTFSGDIFASTDNDDSYCLGYDKAVVKSDCNKQEQIIEVFPVSVEKSLEAQGYTWVGEDGSTAIGYYTTPYTRSFDSTKLVGGTDGTSGQGYFSRRQIYSDEESDKPSVCDVMTLPNNVPDVYTRRLWLRSKKMMAFGKGSLKVSGTIYHGAIRFDNNTNENLLHVRIGIGREYNSAKWFYLEDISLMHQTGNYGWRTTQVASEQRSFLIMSGGSIKGPGRQFDTIILDHHFEAYDGIPIGDNDGLFGYLFIDFLGATVDGYNYTQWPWSSCDIADFKVEYSRDEVWIPTNASSTRGRSILNERNSSREYTANNNNQSTGEYNVDLIFASDDNMEYGYGLLCNNDGSYMTTAPFGTSHSLERPEQHLANRIADYWANSKRMIPCEVRSNRVGVITPMYTVTLAGTTFAPISISQNWRDDVTKLVLLEI